MPPVADQRIPRSNLSSTPSAGRIDDRKESDSPGLIAARPPLNFAPKLGDELALRGVDAAGERDRVDIDEPAARKRQQRQALPAGGRSKRQPHQRVAVEAVDDAAVAQESALELRRLTGAKGERDAGIERDGRVELQRELRRKRRGSIARRRARKGQSPTPPSVAPGALARSG